MMMTQETVKRTGRYLMFFVGIWIRFVIQKVVRLHLNEMSIIHKLG